MIVLASNIIKKSFILLFSFLLIASCQNKPIESAIADPSLRVENGFRRYCSFLETPTYIVNKDYVIYQDCYTHKILKTDLASFGTKTVGKEGFAFDKNGVFVKGEFVKIDTTGFTVLADNAEMDLWWKTNTKFFKNTTELNRTDADTFPSGRGKRQKIVFEDDDSDKTIIDYNFYKKNNRIYYHKKRTDFDAETFTPINKSLKYYKDEDVVFYLNDKGILELNDVDVNSARVFNNFLMDKNYLYHENIKIIKSNGIELLAIFPGYRKGCGLDSQPGSNFYLFKNDEGFWLVKISNTISYRFLGKTFDRKWDVAFQVIDLPKKYNNPRTVLPFKPEEKKLKETENYVYNARDLEELPQYPGGIEKLYALVQKNFVMPKAAVKNKVDTGAIFLGFVIEKDGTISDIKVLRDFGYGSGKELVRAFKLSSNWKPATIKCKPVRCYFTFPYHIVKTD
ncbi:energy transducer TonB [Flavobacterium procerum]|uniref:Energy transducer TonB n=1 Tax=Flavobacterium procerum TaxID=1455569 RepID=A0ABV6BKL3_9FLAO